MVQYIAVSGGACDEQDSITRNELLDIRNSTPDNLLPTFEYSDVLLDILFGGAAFLFKRSRRRKRGKRAGALVKSRQRGLRTPLPSIHLANLRSLANKSDELQLLTRTNKDFLNSAVLCFTETKTHAVFSTVAALLQILT